jgi:leucine-rich PPR motif-containing protein
MIERGFTPNSVVCSKIVSSLYRDSRINEATVILDKMVDFDLLTVHNKCSDKLVKNHATLEAQKIADSLDKSVICNSLPNNIVYNIAIDGLCKSGKVDEARSVLSILMSRGFLPDNFTYCSLIHACSASGNVDEAFKLRDEMLERGVIPNITTYNALINGLCKLGNIDRAQRLFHKLHQKGLVPNVVTYNILISCYCRIGDLDKASKLREKMTEEGISTRTLP